MGLMAVGCWLFFMVRLVGVDRAPTAENQLEISAAEAAAGFREGEEWRGLYHRDRKVGFVRVRKAVIEGGYAIEYLQVMRLSALGTDQEIELDVRTESDSDFVLTAFEGQLASGDATFAVRGRVERLDEPTRYRVHFTLETPESTTDDFIDIDDPPLIEHDVARALLATDPEPGDTFETQFFDPMTQSSQPIVVEYVGATTLSVMGQVVPAHHLRQHVGPRSMDRWVNQLGEVLREDLPLGLSARRESRAEAMYGVVRRNVDSAPPVDLIREVRIPLAATPVDLTRAPRITWHIEGLDAARLELAGGRQQLLDTPSDRPLALRILRDPVDRALTVDALRPDVEVARYATADPFIQSDADPIVRQSRAIVGEERSVSAIAEAINDWVHANLERAMVVSVPSALDVLETRRGDCNEHATLAVALLRAAGVPARAAVGLAWVRDGFYYHAWVEYWHDGWRTMDPTWSQFPADLGHIRLIAGGLERQLELVELFDRPLRIEPAPTDR